VPLDEHNQPIQRQSSLNIPSQKAAFSNTAKIEFMTGWNSQYSLWKIAGVEQECDRLALA
jgi:hypothetical protein